MCASNIFPLTSSISWLCARPPAAATKQSSVAQPQSSTAWRSDPTVADLDPLLLRVCYQLRAKPNGKTNAVQQLLSIFCRICASTGHARQMPDSLRFVAFFPPQQLSKNCRRFSWVGGDHIVRIGVGFIVVALTVGGSIGGSVG